MPPGSRDKTPWVSGMLGKQTPAAWNPGGGLDFAAVFCQQTTGGRQPPAQSVIFLHDLLS